MPLVGLNRTLYMALATSADATTDEACESSRPNALNSKSTGRVGHDVLPLDDTHTFEIAVCLPLSERQRLYRLGCSAVGFIPADT